MRRRITSLSAVAALLAGVAVLSSHFSPQLERRVHADDLKSAGKAVQEARSATWKMSYFQRFTAADGKRSRWMRMANEQRYFYKAPGLYRREDMDEDGKVVFVAIEDIANKATLDIDLRKKVASLRYLADANYSPSGPFATFVESVKGDDLKSLGKEQVEGREADGYRRKFFVEKANRDWSYDFWVDPRTKHLIAQQIPGGDIFDPADLIPAKVWDRKAHTIDFDGEKFDLLSEPYLGLANSASRMHDVALDVAVDDALFDLQAPDGFETKSTPLPSIAEKDVTEFLGIVAGYSGNVFPSNLLGFNQGVEYARFERIEYNWLLKNKIDTDAELALMETMHKWWRLGIPGPGPLHMFATSLVEKGSWKYVGEGVKLGDKNRIVCWYQPKGSKAYHVVYGDLIVKEMDAKDLPLPVGR